MWKKKITLEDVFDNMSVKGGVFSNSIRYPWSASISCEILNEMFMNEFGECTPANLIMKKLDTQGHLPSQIRENISLMLATRYIRRWKHLWETETIEYNPIENYGMEEKEEIERDSTTNSEGSTYTTNEGETTTRYDVTDTNSGESTQTNNLTDTTSNTLTRNLTDGQNITVTNTNSSTNNETQSKYGFNSATAVPDNTTAQTKSDTINQTSQDSATHTGTETNSATQTNTGTVANEAEYTNTKTGTETLEDDRSTNVTQANRTTHDGNETRTLTRSGNIGTLTSQQMLMSERKLREWDFFKEVFRDIIKMIVIPIY